MFPLSLSCDKTVPFPVKWRKTRPFTRQRSTELRVPQNPPAPLPLSPSARATTLFPPQQSHHPLSLTLAALFPTRAASSFPHQRQPPFFPANPSLLFFHFYYPHLLRLPLVFLLRTEFLKDSCDGFRLNTSKNCKDSHALSSTCFLSDIVQPSYITSVNSVQPP